MLWYNQHAEVLNFFADAAFGYGLMELSLRRETKLVLGQRMYQSMNLLQMGTAELDAYLNELSMENPMLEETPPKSNFESRYIHSYSCCVKNRSTGDNMELPIPDKSKNSLCSFLEEQLYTMRLDEELDSAVKFLIINLDSRGYLPRDFIKSGIFRSRLELFERAHLVLRSMEPAGVGACELSDCLCLQLERAGEKDTFAYTICRDWLEHLGRNHINHISKALGISENKIARAKERIKSLEPIPSNGFDDGCCTLWAVPDVEVIFENGEPVIYSSERFMPSYDISSYYSRMADSDGITDEEREYFREKLAQAQWAVSCVKRRRDTLLKCVSVIVEQQRDFFEHGSFELRPCSMADLAYKIGMHPSTVSRAMKNEYIACKWGLFPMSYLFAQEVCGDTPDYISSLIKEIISKEDCSSPLSDNDISKKLSVQGYDIARRTVAKYRDKMNIPSATGRRKR